MKKMFGIYSVAFMKTNGSIRIIKMCCTGLGQRWINTYRTDLCEIKGSGLVCIYSIQVLQYILVVTELPLLWEFQWKKWGLHNYIHVYSWTLTDKKF